MQYTLTSSSDSADHTWSVLTLSAIVGFVVSGFIYPMWTDNVESAQVIARIVQFPQKNPMYMYHTSIYTLVVQVAAILLKAGFSELQLSIFFSGLQGAISFSALSLCTYCFHRNPLTSLITPLLFLQLRQAFPEWPGNYTGAFHGHGYPILFPNHASIYGVVGIFSALLALCLLSLGKKRSGAFLVGIMPGIHPTLAVPLWLGIGCVFLLRRHIILLWLRQTWKYFLLGFGIFLITFIIQIVFIRDIPETTISLNRDYHGAIFTIWNDHTDSHIKNKLIRLKSLIIFFESDLYLLFLATSLLIFLKKNLPESGRIMLIALGGITVVTITYGLLMFIPSVSSIMGYEIKRLLLFRWLNLNSLAFPAISVGISSFLAFQRRNTIAIVLMLALVVFIVFGAIKGLTLASSAANLFNKNALITIRGILFPVMAVILPCMLLIIDSRAKTERFRFEYPVRFAPYLKLVLVIVIILLMGTHLKHFSLQKIRGEGMYTEFFTKAGEGEECLLFGHQTWVHRLQLRTRRCLLLDLAQVDFLTFVPKAISATEHIMNRVYGQSLLHRLSNYKGLWERRTLKEWQEIRREFNVADVIVIKNWKLKLPKVVGSKDYNLYHIPLDKE